MPITRETTDWSSMLTSQLYWSPSETRKRSPTWSLRVLPSSESVTVAWPPVWIGGWLAVGLGVTVVGSTGTTATGTPVGGTLVAGASVGAVVAVATGEGFGLPSSEAGGAALLAAVTGGVISS